MSINQQRYTLFVALPLPEGGHIVVDADEIDFIADRHRDDDDPPSATLARRGGAASHILAGSAKDLLEQINRQRLEQLEAMTFTVVEAAHRAG